MVTNNLVKLEEYRQKIAILEKEIAAQSQKLLSLPRKFGYGSVDELIDAIQRAAGKGTHRIQAKTRKSPKRTRAKITAETKSKVKTLALAGKTGPSIAKEIGISLPSVQNIKKELGLVRKRKPSA